MPPASGFGYGYGGIINLTGLALGLAMIGRELIPARRPLARRKEATLR